MKKVVLITINSSFTIATSVRFVFWMFFLGESNTENSLVCQNYFFHFFIGKKEVILFR